MQWLIVASKSNLKVWIKPASPEGTSSPTLAVTDSSLKGRGVERRPPPQRGNLLRFDKCGARI